MIDVFHKDQTGMLSEDQKGNIKAIKETAELLLTHIDGSINSRLKLAEVPADNPLRGELLRCRALAQTNLEQAVMWAVKGVTKS